MGYYIDIVKLKKKSLEDLQNIIPNSTFYELYSNYLFSNLYPDEYEIPNDEVGTWITFAESNVFYDFFKQFAKTTDIFIIEEETYYKLCNWLENKLKSQTLYDLAISKEYDEKEFTQLIRIYQELKKETIDFETEFVVYVH